jgi:magnesium chelatase family protein
LLDRFDLIVRVGRVEEGEYSGPEGEPSAKVAERVEIARSAQLERGVSNRQLAIRTAVTRESAEATAIVSAALGSALLTARGADRVRRVARTIADLEGVERVEESHMAEAIGLRGEWRDD